MRQIISLDDHESLRKFLGSYYPMKVRRILKHRDWIGYVFIVEAARGKYVLKVYRPFHEQHALNTLGILKYLAAQGYPSTYDMQCVYDFIAIRHYDIQATITQCQGYSIENLVNQHAWLMRWRDLCAQKLKW